MSYNVQRKADAAKKQENAYREMDAIIADTQKVMHLANFEHATTAKIDRRIKKVIRLDILCYCSKALTFIFLLGKL
jgi:hypothetical protein